LAPRAYRFGAIVSATDNTQEAAATNAAKRAQFEAAGEAEAARTPRGLRIGEAAKLVGTTPRTIRYYEELGLLEPDSTRSSGKHRLYGENEVERLRDALRLKELLGLSLDELKVLLEAESARAALRAEWFSGSADTERQIELLTAASGHVDRQLELVTSRRREIDKLERDLRDRRSVIVERTHELEAELSE
jgi:DNA-binding transcriptional MerR regulator